MENDEKFVIIIPARYGSSRFPGKPLAEIGGEAMVVRVARKALEVCRRVVVATDDKRILRCVEQAGIKGVMTSPSHPNGTSRVCEAYELLGEDADVVVNLQGDEPFVSPVQIRSLIDCFRNRPDIGIATLVRKFDADDGFGRLKDPNLVKVVRSDDGEALYFSRSVVPYVRDYPENEWASRHDYFTHVGMYAYRVDVLRELAGYGESPLQKAESLEQLGWLSHGKRIFTVETSEASFGIDTPADLKEAERKLKERERLQISQDEKLHI